MDKSMQTENEVFDATTGFSEEKPHEEAGQRFRRVFFARGMVAFGLVVLLLLFCTAIFAPLLAPYDPYRPGTAPSLLQPTLAHPLGTDLLGRDTLSRLIYGSRTALMVGFISVAVASLIGITLGLVSGYFGGFINVFIMRAVDAFMCFPMILLALVVAAVLGGGLQNVIIALSVATVPGYARITHGLTLSIKENDFILAQQAMGAKGCPYHYPAYSSQCPAAADRADDHATGQPDPGRGRAEFPGHRHRTSGRRLGGHGQRRL